MAGKSTLIIGLLIVILIIGGFVAYLYFFKDKNNEVVIPQKDVYVEFIDAKTKQRIATNFTVISNNTVLVTDTSDSKALKKITVPQDVKLLEFYNIHPDYYTDFNGLIGSKASIEVYPIGKMYVNQSGSLNQENGHIDIQVSTDYQNREVSFCIAWSVNIIDVNNNQYPEINVLNDKLKCVEAGFIWTDSKEECGRLCKMHLKNPIVTNASCSIGEIKTLPPSFFKERVDKCFYSKKTIEINKTLDISLDYKAYKSITYENVETYDFIHLYLFDSNNDLKNIYRFEIDGKDTAASTLKYTIQ